jgi:hypothetical protein
MYYERSEGSSGGWGGGVTVKWYQDQVLEPLLKPLYEQMSSEKGQVLFQQDQASGHSLMTTQDPGILVRRYDPEMAILGLFVLTVSVLARPHKDQVGQNSIIFVRILDLTYPQTVVVRIVDQRCKYCKSVRIIYMTS